MKLLIQGCVLSRDGVFSRVHTNGENVLRGSLTRPQSPIIIYHLVAIPCGHLSPPHDWIIVFITLANMSFNVKPIQNAFPKCNFITLVTIIQNKNISSMTKMSKVNEQAIHRIKIS